MSTRSSSYRHHRRRPFRPSRPSSRRCTPRSISIASPEQDLRTKHIRDPCEIGEWARVYGKDRGADLTELGLECALGTEWAWQVFGGPTVLAWHEDACAGGLGSLREGHLRVDGGQGDGGDDDVRASECLGERGHVGEVGRRDARAARGQGLVLLLVDGGLRLR